MHASRAYYSISSLSLKHDDYLLTVLHSKNKMSDPSKSEAAVPQALSPQATAGTLLGSENWAALAQVCNIPLNTLQPHAPCELITRVFT